MIKLTEKAIKTVKDLIDNSDHKDGYLRVGVTGGGCSGFQYVLQLEEEVIDDKVDTQFQVEGLTIVVDRKSALYLDGCELDYMDDDLIGQGFAFSNPNSASSCGCGKSFSG